MTRIFPISLLVSVVAALMTVPAVAQPTVEIATLKFGTVNWELNVIKTHELDRKHGLDLRVTEISGKQAADLMLLGGEVDVIVSDWIWVSSQRSAGRRVSFVPYSRSVGSLLVPPGSPVKSLADLAGRRIGIAGGPTDKSWIILRALARERHGIDLAEDAEPVFGAPPLLNEKAQQGELDAIVNYWHFLARLEAKGFQRMIEIGDAAEQLGLDPDLPLLGYVFMEDWAKSNPESISGLVRASEEAKQIMRTSDEEWTRLRPMMGAEDEASFIALRESFREGIPEPGAVANVESARKMFAFLAAAAGSTLVGDAKELADGVFYRHD